MSNESTRRRPNGGDLVIALDQHAWRADRARIAELAPQLEDAKLRFFLCACIEHVLPSVADRCPDMGRVGAWLRIARQHARGEAEDDARERALREAKIATDEASSSHAPHRMILSALVGVLERSVRPCEVTSGLCDLAGGSQEPGAEPLATAAAMAECAWQKTQLEILATAPAILLDAARHADDWFPVGAFAGILEKARTGILATRLSSLGEVPLVPMSTGAPIIRLLVDATFKSSVLVVASLRQGRWYVRSAVETGAGRVECSAERVLEGALLDRFATAWDRLGLHRGYVPSSQEGHDGAVWFLESVESSRYRAIWEWEPRGALRDLGSCLSEACDNTDVRV